MGLPWWLSGKETAFQCRRHRFNPWVRTIPWRRKWQPTPVFLLGNPMDRGAWQAIVHGITKRVITKRVKSEILATEQQQQQAILERKKHIITNNFGEGPFSNYWTCIVVSDINQESRSKDGNIQRDFLWPGMLGGALFIILSIGFHKLEKWFSYHPHPSFESSLILPSTHIWSLQSQPWQYLITENESWTKDEPFTLLCSCSSMARS